jgi:hypothetical protein
LVITLYRTPEGCNICNPVRKGWGRALIQPSDEVMTDAEEGSDKSYIPNFGSSWVCGVEWVLEPQQGVATPCYPTNP